MNSQTENDVRTITDLVDIENKSVLELGCGAGRITFELTDKVQEIVVWLSTLQFKGNRL